MTFAPVEENITKASDFVREELRDKGASEEDIKVFCACADELFASIIRGEREGSPVILSVEEVRNGIMMRFMHAGPLYNPCPEDRESLVRREMDEISFEFKYGHNVLSLFRKRNERMR